VEERSDPVDDALTILAHVSVAVAVLLVGAVIATAARWLVRRLIRRHEQHLGASITRLIGGAIYCTLIALAIGGALIAIGVPPILVAGIGFGIVVTLLIALSESVCDLAATVNSSPSDPSAEVS
jgi:hypothetical protein